MACILAVFMDPCRPINKLCWWWWWWQPECGCDVCYVWMLKISIRYRSRPSTDFTPTITDVSVLRGPTVLCCVDPTHTPPREAAVDSTLLVAQSANQQNRCFGRSNRLCIDGTSGFTEFQSADGPQVLLINPRPAFTSTAQTAGLQICSRWSQERRFITTERTTIMWISVILQVLFVVFISRNV